MSDTATQVPKWIEDAQRLSSASWRSAVLPLADLQPMRIDDSAKGYQRPLSDPRVQALVENFDAGEARELYVSRRDDGSFWILDGQHTWAALRQVGFEEWPSRVFFNLSVEEEAQRFAEYQNNTRPIPAVVRWNAEIVSGNPIPVAIERVLGDFYLRISTNKLRAKDGFLGIGSRAVPENLYKLGGEKLLKETYQLAIDAWGQNKESFLGRVLQGLGYLLWYATGEFDRARFVAVLKNTTPKQIVEGIGATGSGGAQRAGAMLLHDLYIDGAPGYPKVRKNDSAVPRLPEKAPKEGVEAHEFWTEDTANVGRVTVEAIPAPEPQPTKEEKAAARAEVKAAKAAEKEAAKAAKAAAKAESASSDDSGDEPDESEVIDDTDGDSEDFAYPEDAVEPSEV